MALPSIYSNQPQAGSITWTEFGVRYDNVDYSIPAGDTNKKFTWWDYDAGVEKTIRRNLARNPRRIGTLTDQNFFNSLGGGTTAGPVTFAGKTTWSRLSRTTGGNNIFRMNVELAELENGQTYTVALDVANDGASSVTISLDWADVSPATNFTIAAGEARRISFSATRPTYDSTMRFVDLVLPDNSSILVTDVLVEKGVTDGSFFSGDTANNPLDTFTWTGNPNVSVSVASVAVGQRNYAPDPAITANPAGGANVWSGSGGAITVERNVPLAWAAAKKGLRSTWTTAPTTGVGVMQGSTSSLKTMITSPGVWTISVRTKASAGVVSAGGGFTEPGTGNSATQVSAVDLGDGTYRRWVTINIANWATFQASPNPRIDYSVTNVTVGSVVEMSDVDIYQGPYDPNRVWFSGDSGIVSGGYKSFWLGTVNNSTSVLAKVAPAVVVGDVLPNDLAPQDILLFINRNGIGVLAPTATVIEGSLIATGSIIGDAVAANQIDAYHLKANSITANAISSGAVTADAIAAGAITTSKLTVADIGGNAVANGSFEDAGEGWMLMSSGTGASVDLITGAVASGTYAVSLTRGTAADLIWAQAPVKYIPVTAASNRSWYISTRARGSAALASGYSVRAYWYLADKVTAASTAFTTITNNVALTTSFAVYEGQTTPPANAAYMRIAIVNSLSGSIMYVDEVRAQEVVVSGMIGGGAVSTNQLATNAITTDKIQANTITANKLVLSDFENLLNNPEPISLLGWTNAGGVTYAANEFVFAAGSKAMVNDNAVPVKQGDKFLITVNARAVGTITGTAGGIRVINQAGADIGAGTFNINPTTTLQRYVVVFEVPAGVTTIRLRYATATTAGTIYTSKFEMRRMNNAELIVDGAIITEKLDANAVTATKIAANAVVADKIAANAVTTVAIAANAVTAEQISANAVTANKLAANAITANSVASGAITTDKLSIATTGGNQVANGSFEDGTQGWGVFSAGGDAVADIVQGIASGGAFALRLVRGTSGTNLAVCQSDDKLIPVTPSALRTWFVSASASATAITANGFTFRVDWFKADKTPSASPSAIVANSVALTTAWATFDGQVNPPADARYMRMTVQNSLSGSTMYVDEVVAREAVSTIMIQGNAITADKIATNAITTNALAANAVTAEQISANAVTAAKIAANAVTATQISANAIDSKTITGATVQTLPQASRGVKLDSFGLRAWDAAGTETVSIASATGAASFNGEFNSKTTGQDLRFWSTFSNVGQNDSTGRIDMTPKAVHVPVSAGGLTMQTLTHSGDINQSSIALTAPVVRGGGGAIPSGFTPASLELVNGNDVGSPANSMAVLTAGSYVNLGAGSAGLQVHAGGNSTNFFGAVNLVDGDATMNRIRLLSTSDASLSSSAHAFQIGPSDGAHLLADNNEIMARDAGSAGALYLQNDGGILGLGASGATVRSLAATANTQTNVGTGGWGLMAINSSSGDMGRASGALSTGYIPDLPASQITSGAFSQARIPHMTYANSNLYMSSHPSNNASGTYWTVSPTAGNAAWLYSSVADNNAFVVSHAGVPFFRGVYSNDVTSTRRAMWIGSDGWVGYASSSREKKQDISNAELSIDALRQIPVVNYRYKEAVVKEEENPDDPESRAPVEIGTLAEDMHDLGLWEFVSYDGRGEDAVPAGIHYEMLSLAAIKLGQHLADENDELKTRLDTLEARLTALEEK